MKIGGTKKVHGPNFRGTSRVLLSTLLYLLLFYYEGYYAYDVDFPKITKLSINFPFEKNFSRALQPLIKMGHFIHRLT